MMKRLLFVGFVWKKVTEVVIDIEIKSIAAMENKVMNDIYAKMIILSMIVVKMEYGNLKVNGFDLVTVITRKFWYK